KLLETLPLRERYQRLVKKLKGVAERVRLSQADLASRDMADAVESVFYTVQTREERIAEEFGGLLEESPNPPLLPDGTQVTPVSTPDSDLETSRGESNSLA